MELHLCLDVQKSKTKNADDFGTGVGGENRNRNRRLGHLGIGEGSALGLCFPKKENGARSFDWNHHGGTLSRTLSSFSLSVGIIWSMMYQIEQTYSLFHQADSAV